MGCRPKAGTSVAENANRTSGVVQGSRAQGITALIWTAKPILTSRSLMTGAWNSSQGQSGGFNVTPVTPIFKYKYKKICKIAKLQIVLFLKK